MQNGIKNSPHFPTVKQHINISDSITLQNETMSSWQNLCRFKTNSSPIITGFFFQLLTIDNICIDFLSQTNDGRLVLYQALFYGKLQL